MDLVSEINGYAIVKVPDLNIVTLLAVISSLTF